MTLAPWILLLAFAVTAATTPLAAVFGRRWGLVDHPGARKIHKAPMPRSGGIALYAGIVIAVQTFWMMGFLSREATATLPGIAFGALIVFLVGVIDDRYGVRVPVKFLGQFLAAGVLVLFEVKVSVFIKDHAITTILTMIWIVGITNAFNLLDNMDGLSATIAAIAAVIFHLIAVEQDAAMVQVLAPAVAGAAIGFLLHNWNPARIFLGDSGSLVLGFLLAAISVQGVYLAHSRLTHLPILAPLFILAVPLFDTLSVIVIRIRRGVSIFQADRNHLSHRLVALGLSHREAVAFLGGIAVAMGLPALLLATIDRRDAVLLLCHQVLLLALISLLMRAGLRAKGPDEEGEAR